MNLEAFSFKLLYVKIILFPLREEKFIFGIYTNCFVQSTYIINLLYPARRSHCVIIALCVSYQDFQARHHVAVS